MLKVITRSLVGLVLVALSAQLVLMWATGVGNPLLVVRDKAMEPVYHRGDLLVVTSITPNRVAEGDLVVVELPEAEQRALGLPPAIARRVVGIDVIASKFAFQTSSDRVATATSPADSASLRGAVFANLGQIGWALILLTNRLVILAVSIPAVAFLLVGILGGRSSISTRTDRSSSLDREREAYEEERDAALGQPLGSHRQEDRYDWLQRWCDAQLGPVQERVTPGVGTVGAGWAE